jgi:Zn-dependent oligopeptidase
MLEEVDSENKELIEVKLKKNRVKAKLMNSTQYGVWNMIEKLEEYKEEIGCD